MITNFRTKEKYKYGEEKDVNVVYAVYSSKNICYRWKE